LVVLARLLHHGIGLDGLLAARMHLYPNHHLQAAYCGAKGSLIFIFAKCVPADDDLIGGTQSKTRCAALDHIVVEHRADKSIGVGDHPHR
jgi:hypothetical protein